MGEDVLQQVYLCPRCLEAQLQAGACPTCGEALLTCRPGDADDPCRRPLMDAKGKVRTRAPLWWLRHRVRILAQRYEEKS